LDAFVIMPFSSEFDDVYHTIQRALSGAIEGEPIDCRRLDQLKAPGRITDDLVHELNAASLCIADLTGANPNVMWEVGYATAKGKPLIPIAQDLRALPFDIRDFRTIGYERALLERTLLHPLRAAVRETLARFQVHRSAVEGYRTAHPLPGSVAITGSIEADLPGAARKLEAALADHLGKGKTFYVGSYGATDEAAVDFLTRSGEKVVVVGYHAYDLSRRMVSLIQERKLPFVDAKEAALPQGLGVSSSRDLFFAARADTIILGWNGHSKRTEQLLRWCVDHRKNHAVVFY
jgi:hypothetical protein